MCRRQRRVIEAEPGHHPRPEVLDDDVGAAGQALEHAARVVGAQIEDHALLAAVGGVERMTLTTGATGHRARRVAGRRLHFDDPRPHVRQ
jgi:hypothetical protein